MFVCVCVCVCVCSSYFYEFLYLNAAFTDLDEKVPLEFHIVCTFDLLGG